MGIDGAAIATVIAQSISCILYMILIFRKKNNDKYRTLSSWRLDKSLLKRLIRFGLPSGMQFFVDVSGFSIFILLIGRIGAEELAASSIAFNINTLAFMPMIGFGVAISVMVGQFQGEGRSDLAERSVYSGIHICFIYMTIVATTYLLTPGIYIAAFSAKADPASFASIREFIIKMLRFVAVYTVFDTLNIIFASALKGAGDTKFVMIMIICLSVLGLTIPSYLALVVFNSGIYVAWGIVSAYVILLGFSFLLRFLSGKWKTMRVIEQTEPILPLGYPEVPTGKVEI